MTQQEKRKWVDVTDKRGYYTCKEKSRLNKSEIKPVNIKAHIAIRCDDANTRNKVVKIIKETSERDEYKSMLFHFKTETANTEERVGAHIAIYPEVYENEGKANRRTIQFAVFMHDVCAQLTSKAFEQTKTTYTDKYMKGTYGIGSYREGNCIHEGNVTVYDFGGKNGTALEYRSANSLDRDCSHNPDGLDDPIERFLTKNQQEIQQSSPMENQGIFGGNTPIITYPVNNDDDYFMKTLLEMTQDNLIPEEAGKYCNSCCCTC